DGQVVKLETRVLVGADDKACGGVSRCAPVRQVVRGIGSGRAGRGRRGRCSDLDRDDTDRAGGGAAGEKRGQSGCGKGAAHQNVTFTPPFIVQLYSSYWRRFRRSPRVL